MSTVTVSRPAVQIPRDSDGLIVPGLIPIAAYLCVEEYADGARSRILERLADGVSPRDCARDGLIEWRDLAEVERLLPRPAAALPPIVGGAPARSWDECSALDPVPPFDDDAPAAADDFPRKMTDAEYRQALRDLVDAFTRF